MDKITYSIDEVLGISGLGRTKIYELLKSGELPARKLGKRTLILGADLNAFLTGLQSYPTQQNSTRGQ
jgi:excisionase family DNA binding protein